MHRVKILHCADVHIGAAESFLGTGAASRRYETLLTFERIVAAAKESGTQLLLIAGDLFDSNGIEQTFFERTFEAIASAPEIKVIVACGNHDPLTADSPFKKLSLPKNLYVLGVEDDVISFDELGVRVYGKSFSEVHLKGRARFSILPPNDDKINLMVIHGDLSSDLNSDYNAITQGFIEQSGMDYIALGHVHKRTGVSLVGGSFCAYCGCPEGQGFDETDQKGVYIGEVSKGACDLKFLPISKRQHICEFVNVSDCKNSVEAAEHIAHKLEEKYGTQYGENLYKIILSGEVDENCELGITELVSRLQEKLYFVKVSDRTEIKPDLDALSGEKSLKGIFVKRMLARIETASEDEKPIIRRALTLGLRAFRGELDPNED